MFCGIYGYPEEKNKRLTWELIRRLIPPNGKPWLCVGDLNDTLATSEKIGGNIRSVSQLEFGRDVVRDCGLFDLGFEGSNVTWSNGRRGQENIQARLDRALANEEFMARFNPIKVSHLAKFGSDHVVLKITLEDFRSEQPKKGRKFSGLKSLGPKRRGVKVWWLLVGEDNRDLVNTSWMQSRAWLLNLKITIWGR